jgi:hypothetical protein
VNRDERAAVVRAIRAQVRVVASGLDPRGLAPLYVDELVVKVSHRARPEWARGGAKAAGRAGCYHYDGEGDVGYIIINAAVCHTPERFVSTLLHEFAHALNRWVNGREPQPHGEEWQDIMRRLGQEPDRCHSYDDRL